MDFIKLNKDTYNKIAKHFSDTRAFVWDDLKPLKRYVKDGDRILDLGCGNGRLYQLFSDLSIDYIGVDQSEELIKQAQTKFPDIRFETGEMTKLDVEDNTFDAVYCIAAYQHLPDEQTRLAALNEMKRMAKQGGYIVMTNWNLFSQTAYKRHPQFAPGDFMIPWKDGKTGTTIAERYYHGFTVPELEALARKVGLRIESQYYSWKGQESTPEKATNIVSVFRVDKDESGR